MIRAARLYSLFVLLLVVGIFIAGLPSNMGQGLTGIMGGAIFVVLAGLPIVPALTVLGNKEGKSKTESFAMFVNKSYLFLFAAAAVGFAFRQTNGLHPAFVSYLFGGGDNFVGIFIEYPCAR